MQYSGRPMHLFGGSGLLLFGLGMILGLVLVIGKLFYGISLSNRTSPLAAVLLVILGVQFFLFGILADIGIIGLPNAGKSTLLSRMTLSNPKIDSYPFT